MDKNIFNLNNKNIIFKIISFCLLYPDHKFYENIKYIYNRVKYSLDITATSYYFFYNFILFIKYRNIFLLQEYYVNKFDKGKNFSLHLFEHVYGGSNQRGKAMVDLQNIYSLNNYKIATNELPDYLPLFLEYLSLIPYKNGVFFLNETQNIVLILKSRSRKKGSYYYYLFSILNSILDRNTDSIVNDVYINNNLYNIEHDNYKIDKEWLEKHAFEDENNIDNI